MSAQPPPYSTAKMPPPPYPGNSSLGPNSSTSSQPGVQYVQFVSGGIQGANGQMMQVYSPQQSMNSSQPRGGAQYVLVQQNASQGQPLLVMQQQPVYISPQRPGLQQQQQVGPHGQPVLMSQQPQAMMLPQVQQQPLVVQQPGQQAPQYILPSGQQVFLAGQQPIIMSPGQQPILLSPSQQAMQVTQSPGQQNLQPAPGMVQILPQYGHVVMLAPSQAAPPGAGGKPLFNLMDSSGVPAENAGPAGSNTNMNLFSLHSTSSLAGQSSTSSRPPVDTTVWGFALVDPYHPSLQRVPVPPCVVSKTRGIATYNPDVISSSTKPCSSTICIKYLHSDPQAPPGEENGCPLGEACPNFHVSRAYVEKARAISEPLCCGLHNDYFTQELILSGSISQLTHSRYTLVLDDRSEVELLPSQLAFTVGLEKLQLRGPNTRIIHMKKHICRLHLEGKCKWTKDCGHVHVCREFFQFLQAYHYPSLWFLLNTETNTAKIVAKLSETRALLDFIKSKSSVPLMTLLIEQNKVQAIEAILKCGGTITTSHAQQVRQMNIEVPTTAVVGDASIPIVNPPANTAPPVRSADVVMPTFSPGNSLTGAPATILHMERSTGSHPASAEPQPSAAP